MCERPFPSSLASRRLSDRTVEDGGETVLCLLSVVKGGLWPSGAMVPEDSSSRRSTTRSSPKRTSWISWASGLFLRQSFQLVAEEIGGVASPIDLRVVGRAGSFSRGRRPPA